MSDRIKGDNIYEVGTVITSVVNPELKLAIVKYYQRIYYCAVVGDPDHKHFAFFERELISPANQSSKPTMKTVSL